MTDTAPRPGPERGVGNGRPATSSPTRLLRADGRLPSAPGLTEQVDSALRGFDEQLAAHEVRDPDGSLRATARSALEVAHGVPEYDVAFAPARGRVAIRIKHSRSGLEVHVVELGARPRGDRAGHPVHLMGEL